MEAKVTPEELECLRRLDTESPQKPELPPAMAERLVEQGLAITLVEGGLQLTALGREYLSQESAGN
jgi:hypothetical protein